MELTWGNFKMVYGMTLEDNWTLKLEELSPLPTSNRSYPERHF